LLAIKKIVFPLDLVETHLPVFAVHQAAAVARHFGSEILLLYVVKPLTFMGSSETVRELIEQAVSREQERLDSSLGSELNSLPVKRLVLKGDPAAEILRVAHDTKCDLIVMPTHGYGSLQRFLIGSVTAKVLHHSECPVWTGAQMSDMPAEGFAIRKILTAVDFSPHSLKTARWAKEMAAEFGAELTLAHATPSTEIYGPGGRSVLSEMKQELDASAARRMAKFQQDSDVHAETYIGSGDVRMVVSQAAEETRADLIIVGRRSTPGGRLGTNAYGIIRQTRLPIVCV
jgi:nucleotide-binding universal stress UspA family protein